MVINFVVAGAVCVSTPRPPEEIRQLVEEIRMPDHAPPGHEIGA